MEKQKNCQQREEVFPLYGEECENSYMCNSSSQKLGVENANEFIKEGILEKLEIEQFIVASSTYNIVDMGCAVGAKTLSAVQSVMDSVKLKLYSLGLQHVYDSLEFHIFFNDLVSSDSNTFFRSIPVDKPYYVAGVPGSFHNRLFPKSSLHFIYSGYSLHWLSKVPEGMAHESSPAFNKGENYWTNSPKEVAQAYEAQFEREIGAFLNARAIEVVSGGLVAFSIVCVPPNSKCITTTLYHFLANVLLEMAATGLTSEEKVNSFNLPVYLPTPPQLEAAIKKNSNFVLERMEPLHRSREDLYRPDFPARITMHFRAGLEGLFSNHFGSEIIDDVFDRFKKKVAETSVLCDLSYKQVIESFVLLKRKPY